MKISAGSLVLFALWASACGGSRDCTNASCECPAGANCDFVCDAPPCHVDCAGNNPSCTGACGNGTCTCGAGSNCDFTCDSGPCHVDCQGDNSACTGTCANGTCSCAQGSSCEFSCLDDNCKFNCDGDCAVLCGDGTSSNSSCRINSCKAGEPVVCPDGKYVVCGRECPKEAPEGEG